MKAIRIHETGTAETALLIEKGEKGVVIRLLPWKHGLRRGAKVAWGSG